MTVEHNTLSGSELHEPKGTAAAGVNEIYISDGAGSGSWRHFPHSSLYYDNIGTGTTIAAPTAYTLIGPATTGDSNPHEFTHNSLGRLTYTGASTLDVQLTATISFKHSTGAGTDCYFQIFKNGVAIAGGQNVTDGDTAYHMVALNVHAGQAATNDYFEVFCKASAGNIVVHAINLHATGKV